MTAVIAAADRREAPSLRDRLRIRGHDDGHERDVVGPAQQVLARGVQDDDREDRKDHDTRRHARDKPRQRVASWESSPCPRLLCGSPMYHSRMTETSPGRRLRDAVEAERPLQVAGTVNAYSALLAERAGFRALYLSGAGVANASFGLPDLGITSLNDVCEDARRICGATGLPLLVDADTGFGAAFSIARTTRELIRAGAAGMHLEDQVQAKRCGHRPGKELVAAAEMATGSARRSMRAATPVSWSWRARMRTPSRDSVPRSTGPPPTSTPAPT